MKKLTTIALVGSALSLLSPNIHAQTQQQDKTSITRPVVPNEQKQKRQEELVKEIDKIIAGKIADADRTLSNEEKLEFMQDAFLMMENCYYHSGLTFDETLKYIEQNLKIPPRKETEKVETLSLHQKLENEKKAQENKMKGYPEFCEDIKDDVNDLIDKYYSYHRFIMGRIDPRHSSMGSIQNQQNNIETCYNKGLNKEQTLAYIEDSMERSVSSAIASHYRNNPRTSRSMDIAKTVMEKYESVRNYDQKVHIFNDIFQYPLLDNMINQTDSIYKNIFSKNVTTLTNKKNNDGSYAYSKEEINEYYDYIIQYLKDNLKVPALSKDAKPKTKEEYFVPKTYNSSELTQNR